MKRFLSVGLLALAAGCGPTSEDVLAEPVRFTITVGAPWDRVGTCLAAFYIGKSFDAHYLPVPSSNRAQLIVNFPAMSLHPPQGMFVFDLEGGDRTTITFRRRKLIASIESSEQEARAAVTDCAK